MSLFSHGLIPEEDRNRLTELVAYLSVVVLPNANALLGTWTQNTLVNDHELMRIALRAGWLSSMLRQATSTAEDVEQALQTALQQRREKQQ